MPIHILTLKEKHELAKGTIAFVFNKPEGFTFKPGQYGGFTLINPRETDNGGITRRFSFLSIPADNHIAFATRIQKSAYKKMLNELPIGGEIKLAGPTGNFILHEDVNVPAVLIAGGIGITPFMSMIRHHTAQQSSQKIILFYGNNSIDDSILLHELQELERTNPQLQIIPTMANEDRTWVGETGFIDEVMIRKYVQDLQLPWYYICGSPAMVTALQELLAEMDINEEHIKVEDFPGY